MAETSPIALVAPVGVNGTAPTFPSPPLPSTIKMPSPPPPPSPVEQTPQSSKTTTPHPTAVYPVFVMPDTLPRPPFIDISGIPNFRSLGGYRSADGKTIVRPNLFYRCAHPTQLTVEGLEQLTTGLGVKAVYDLRSGPEVARTTAGVSSAAAEAYAASNNGAEPTTPIPSLSSLYTSLRHFTPVYATEDTGPEALARKLGWYSSPSSSDLPYSYSEGFVNAYRHIAIHGAPAYTKIFRHILTQPEDPFVFHCTAGKDRTGVFAALLLRLAGVDDETICWEYAITEPGLGEWRTLFMARMSGGAGLHDVAAASSSPATTRSEDQNGQVDPPSSSSSSSVAPQLMSRQEAARVCGSRAGNMRAWLTLVLDGEFGGPEAYMREKCGFSDADIHTIKQNLVLDFAAAGEDAVVRPCAIEGWTADGGCQDVDVE